MDFPIQIHTIRMGLLIIYSKNNVFQPLKIVFIIANSEGPDEMQHHAAFRLVLHCLPNTSLGVSSTQRVHN